MKKTEVYVVVDTPKKAKKLKRVLDMFGERTYSESSIQDCLDNTENALGFDEEENAFMSGYVNRFEESRTKVSIKELRNILAKEHLKKGDVVVAGINGSDNKWLVKFESFRDYGEFLGYYTDLQSLYELTSHTGSFDNFIRYATEEENAFLEPVNNFINSDIAIVERLHDTLLENHGYSLGSKLLTDARILANKLKNK